ncbi:glycoside hydrolase family 5 protein [Alteriqipengyuania lutimaris]|uniref:glycoside hydrolase family 5 protein n=1 Tax=Alteriqipengyuania lutimaris TaxID=1538146 RepID=UPI001851C703|nr:glycoside hydrolase family 5 protein [Alteriqipengyuania lutimaris]MBB3034939.1 endoglucanase [Alteriqipengyuania lutimaris]
MRRKTAGRWPARHLLGTAMVLSLAACGGDNAGPPPAPVATPAPVPTPTPTPVPTPSPTPSSSALSQADAQLGPCINLANYLEAPNEGDWGPRLRDSDLEAIAAGGFETVRFPARFSGHQQTTPPYTIDAAFLDRAEHIVDTARAEGLRVILDNHNFDELMANPTAEHDRFVAIWKQVAERFGDKDAEVWFELMNEPYDNLTNARLPDLYADALDEIRATNPTRPVVVGGQSYSGIGSLASFEVPDDPYLIATFHYYDPFGFTHQGAPWITPVQPTGVSWGSAADRNQLAADVQRARDYMARSGRPLFLGEYGVYEGVPLAQRAEYYEAVTDAFAAADIDGCVWGYQNTMPFRDYASGNWYEVLLDAIGL